MSDIQTWSNTAASNNAAPPNGFPEGMAPSTVNDAAREVMAAVSRYRSDTDGVNTSAGTNTVTLTASRTVTAYAQGDLYTFKAGGTNTGAVTFNVSALGAKAVQFNGAALVGGEIVSGLMYTVVYDGTQFQLMNVTAVRIISVTDNTNAALRVTQLGTGNSLEIEDTTNPDSSPFIVNSSGQLIQGYTTAVASKVITTAATSANQIQGNTAGNSSLGVFNWSSNASFSSSLVFNKSKSGTIGTLSTVTDGDNLGIIQFNGSDNNASPTFNVGALISAQVAGTVATNSIPSRLNFSVTDNGGTSATVRMSLSPEGYLGLGSAFTTPEQMLDIRANNTGLTNEAPLNVIRFTDADTTTAANQPMGKIEFYSPDLDNATVGAYILGSAVGTAGGGTIRFGAAANGVTAAEVCRVADTGFTMTKDTAGLGYGTGTGGAVTQATSRTTGVTLNKTNGAITLFSAAGTATWESFTVTNSTVAATDVVILSQKSGTDLYMLEVTAVAAGSFRISFATTGGTTTEQPVFNFAVIKAVAA